MRENLKDQIESDSPARRFKMPYSITSLKFQSLEDDYQALAVGLVDGAIILIDLILGVEKHYFEKHPSAISSLDFFLDKALISGSICGRVNISDIENLGQTPNPLNQPVKFWKAQNLQDRRVPIA